VGLEPPGAMTSRDYDVTSKHAPDFTCL